MESPLAGRANFIAGRWVNAAHGGVYPRHNPARIGESIGDFPASTAEDIDAAVAAAAEAWPAWSGLPAAKRAAILFNAAQIIDEHAAEIAAAMTTEMGKPIRESLPEATRCAAVLRYFAGEGWRGIGENFEQTVTGSVVRTLRRPRGVIGLITPWNFPAAIPAWKIAPALVFGNTVVIKLAEDAPLSGLALVRYLAEAGLPPGVLNAVVGFGESAGAALVRHPGVTAVSFTGSVAVGREVRDVATSLGKDVQLEMGGQNPLIVMADADLSRATEAAYAGAFWSAGQKCTATRRIFVETPVYGQFRDRLLARIAKGHVGDPADDRTEVGPLVNEKQWRSVRTGIQHAVEDGAQLLVGGDVPDERGYFISPTVFEKARDEDFISREEVFGPVTSLYPTDSLDDAIVRSNGVAFGLSAAIFTSSLSSAHSFTRNIQAGVLHVNSQTPGAEVHVPFGGLKDSGWGPHEQGRAAIDFYTNLVTVYEDA